MPRSLIRADMGSMVLELITFVLVGQLLVCGWFLQLSEQLDHKTRLQLFASTLARSLSLGDEEIEPTLRRDLSLPTAVTRIMDCGIKQVCLEVSDEGKVAVGVGRK